MSENTQPISVVVLDRLTGDELKYVAKWMAKSFAWSDSWSYMACGATYSEDPELHELFYEAIIERSSTIATLLTTSDRNAFRFQYAPFCENKTFDWQYRSGRDDAWDRWVVRAGGVEAIKDRLHLDIVNKERLIKERYGDGMGIECYRSGFFAVHPDYQGRGYGRAMQAHTDAEAERSGVPFFFFSAVRNVPFYERVGCQTVGEPFRNTRNLPEGFPEGCDHSQMVVASPTK